MLDASQTLVCVLCRDEQELTFVDSVNEALESSGLCHRCFFWLRQSAVGGGVITDTYDHYRIGPEPPEFGIRGFGGREFTVTFTDGRSEVTRNLWHQGVVPDHLRVLFTPNATVVAT